jgi:NTP pyrophosphatase (non-canonical NTP hydrolase)
MNQLDQAQATVGAWHRRVFGDDVPLTWLGLKLAEEAGEVCREILLTDGEPIRDGRQPSHVPSEAADALIVLLALADRCGFDLRDALWAQWQVVSKRQFATADAGEAAGIG